MWKRGGHVCRIAFWTLTLFGDIFHWAFCGSVCMFPSSWSSSHCVGLERWLEAVTFVGVAWWCLIACHVKILTWTLEMARECVCCTSLITAVPSLDHTEGERVPLLQKFFSDFNMHLFAWRAIFLHSCMYAYVYMCTATCTCMQVRAYTRAHTHTLRVMVIKIHFYKLKKLAYHTW